MAGFDALFSTGESSACRGVEVTRFTVSAKANWRWNMPRSITANSVAPGWIQTERKGEWYPTLDRTHFAFEEDAAAAASGDVEDVANAASISRPTWASSWTGQMTSSERRRIHVLKAENVRGREQALESTRYRHETRHRHENRALRHATQRSLAAGADLAGRCGLHGRALEPARSPGSSPCCRPTASDAWLISAPCRSAQRSEGHSSRDEGARLND